MLDDPSTQYRGGVMPPPLLPPLEVREAVNVLDVQGNDSQRGSLYSPFLFCGENWRRRAGLRATWRGRRWSSPP